MRKIVFIPVLVLLLMGSIIRGQAKEVPELSKKDLNFIYTFITNDILNAGTVGFLTEPIIFQNFDAPISHISVYPILDNKNFINSFIYYSKNIDLVQATTPNLKKIKINSQLKIFSRNRKPDDKLSNTYEKNCIATLGFGNMYFDGKYFYLICALEAFPIGYDMNDAWCIYKFRKMSNGMIYFTHRYASVGVQFGFEEFELTYLAPGYKDRL